MAKSKSKTTPLMEQYLSIKADYRDVVLLYRMGDFYETFYEDAKTIARVLGIALTKRAHGKSADVPLAGFPYHALDNYLPKLLNAGLRVAICEQVEDPKLAKGVVKREVVEIASPGATLNEKLLDGKSNNFLMAVSCRDALCGLALADVSTGTFWLAEVPGEQLVDHIIRYQPREILVAESAYETMAQRLKDRVNAILTRRDDWVFNRDYAEETLIRHFNAHSLKGFGCAEKTVGVEAAGVIVHYITENYKTRLAHFVTLRTLNLSNYMVLDESTRRNLEIDWSVEGPRSQNTLLSVMDQTVTSMGGRMIKQWLQHPLLDKDAILNRLDAVGELLADRVMRGSLQDALRSVFDMERLLGRIATGRANGRDVVQLKDSLKQIPPVRQLLTQPSTPVLARQASQLQPLEELTDLIDKALVENPPLTLQEGHLIKTGYNPELDELRKIADHGKDWLLEYQQKEREATGISSLKVNYNKVFGYYLEVTHVHKDKVPAHYVRKQTLVNAERYITDDLKEWEEKILGAEEKINKLEYQLFQQIREQVTGHTAVIQENSRLLAEIDCLYSLAVTADDNHYVRPRVDDSQRLLIREGRHPVVEKNLPPGDSFIANDCVMDPADQQIWIITGPNMAGKSTFLRQVGLITLMAQVGSYVPAEEAHVGIVDRIFTRVGASDNLARGESTFLVEMNETANILNNATPRSLILLDEIGRGTSTFDGLSIAWSVVEYLHQTERLRCKSLFATHYHELTELAMMLPRVHNYNVAVEEYGDQVVFLRKIIPGGTDNSYGIYVAQLAGLPPELIERAREILQNLEANELNPHSRKPRLAKRRAGRNVDQNQMNLFQTPPVSEVENRLKALDVNNLTPLQALQKLDELKKLSSK
ncbi:MAG: DNA mismatch repair protein MutS [Calditrichaeota bacterium]|nr:MAG: DNA mismatch repair protein MutS [Calditrichota bacterium]